MQTTSKKQSKADRKQSAPAPTEPGTALATVPTPTATKPEPTAAETKLDTRRAERAFASSAVARFYSGASLPFKSASDKFSDLRLDKAPKAPSDRQAALLAAMLVCDTANNIKSDGTFMRGGFRIFATRNATTGKLRLASETDTGAFALNAQPETGCLSDGIGRLFHYVSGALNGADARNAVFRIDAKAALSEICRLPVAVSKPARDRLAVLFPVPKA